MRQRVQIPVLLCAVLAITACTVVRAIAPGAWLDVEADFFPLHPGTFWVYEVRDAQGRTTLERVLVRGRYHIQAYEAEGTVVEESGGLGGDFDLDVSRHPIVYYRRGPFLYKFSGVNYEKGEIREQVLGEGEEKVLPSDPRQDSRWESDFEIFRSAPGADYSARMVSVAQPRLESVGVRAGVFRRCLRVDSESVLASRDPAAGRTELGFHYVDWYAAGVGLVRSEVRATDRSDPITTVELVSFRDGRTAQ